MVFSDQTPMRVDSVAAERRIGPMMASSPGRRRDTQPRSAAELVSVDATKLWELLWPFTSCRLPECTSSPISRHNALARARRPRHGTGAPRRSTFFRCREFGRSCGSALWDMCGCSACTTPPSRIPVIHTTEGRVLRVLAPAPAGAAEKRVGMNGADDRLCCAVRGSVMSS